MDLEYFVLSVNYPYGELMFIGPDGHPSNAYYRAKRFIHVDDAKAEKDILEKAIKLRYSRYLEQVESEASPPLYDASVLRLMESVNTSGIDVRSIKVVSEVVG